MEKITSLISQLKNASPELTFAAGDDFGWDSAHATVMYDESSPHCEAYLLHEYAHATLGHNRYSRDIELISIERDAWKTARELAPQYNVEIDAEIVENAMDTYRDWMHARSVCPSCDATGIQTSAKTYTCISCRNRWRVNEARRCALRRYQTK